MKPVELMPFWQNNKLMSIPEKYFIGRFRNGQAITPHLGRFYPRGMIGGIAGVFGGRTHYELLLIEVGEAEGPLSGRRIGLYHVGWKVGNSLSELKNVKHRIVKMGYLITAKNDHNVGQSLYLLDPDGNEMELYVGNLRKDWKNDSSSLAAPVKPLAL